MEKQTKAQIISGAVCGILIMLCTVIYLIIGICTNIWHPTWLIIVGGAIACAIIGIIVDTQAKLKDINKDNDEN